MTSAIQPTPILVDPRPDTVKSVSGITIAWLVATIKSGKDLMRSIWYVPSKTPAQTWAELGTGAVDALTRYGALKAFMAQQAFSMSLISPGSTAIISLDELPPRWNVQPNQDGTVTPIPPSTSVPTGLTLTWVTSLPGNVTVSWNEVVGATGVDIQKSTDNGVTWALITATAKTTGGGQVVTSPLTSWIDRELVSTGTQYRIAATTPVGTSDYSSPITLS